MLNVRAELNNNICSISSEIIPTCQPSSSSSVFFVLKFLYTIFPIKIPKIQVLELTDLEYEISRINVSDQVFSHAQNKIKIRSTHWKTYFEKYQIKS